MVMILYHFCSYMSRCRKICRETSVSKKKSNKKWYVEMGGATGKEEVVVRTEI